jgi:UDP-2-acetamido-2-deoxy-ribo-hexuluronate aminotransferase
VGEEDIIKKQLAMEIRMVDLHKQYLRIKPEIDAAMQEVLTSTAFIQGPHVQKFADELRRYTGAGYVIPCANGTDALQIAMMALDVKPGDEVILPVHTYVATAEVIALLGLIPVFIDVDAATFNIDVTQLEEKITAKTKAIVPVHLYGQCADMETILSIAAKNNLYVIEDAAQAMSAHYTFANETEKKAGTMGTIGTTSFFPSKNLGCFGDGGAIFTNDQQLAEKIKMIANHGQRKKYHHELVGVNSRLDTLQAAVLSVKLRYLDEYTHQRNDVADFYDHALADMKGVVIPARDKRSTHAFHQYTLQVERRDELKLFLEHRGIPTMIYYPVPLHLQKAYHNPGYGEGSFPVTEKLSKTVISLPIHTEMKPAELEFICDAIKNFY